MSFFYNILLSSLKLAHSNPLVQAAAAPPASSCACKVDTNFATTFSELKVFISEELNYNAKMIALHAIVGVFIALVSGGLIYFNFLEGYRIVYESPLPLAEDYEDEEEDGSDGEWEDEDEGCECTCGADCECACPCFERPGFITTDITTTDNHTTGNYTTINNNTTGINNIDTTTSTSTTNVSTTETTTQTSTSTSTIAQTPPLRRRRTAYEDLRAGQQFISAIFPSGSDAENQTTTAPNTTTTPTASEPLETATEPTETELRREESTFVENYEAGVVECYCEECCNEAVAPEEEEEDENENEDEEDEEDEEECSCCCESEASTDEEESCTCTLEQSCACNTCDCPEDELCRTCYCDCGQDGCQICLRTLEICARLDALDYAEEDSDDSSEESDEESDGRVYCDCGDEAGCNCADSEEEGEEEVDDEGCNCDDDESCCCCNTDGEPEEYVDEEECDCEDVYSCSCVDSEEEECEEEDSVPDLVSDDGKSDSDDDDGEPQTPPYAEHAVYYPHKSAQLISTDETDSVSDLDLSSESTSYDPAHTPFTRTSYHFYIDSRAALESVFTIALETYLRQQTAQRFFYQDSHPELSSWFPRNALLYGAADFVDGEEYDGYWTTDGKWDVIKFILESIPYLEDEELWDVEEVVNGILGESGLFFFRDDGDVLNALLDAAVEKLEYGQFEGAGAEWGEAEKKASGLTDAEYGLLDAEETELSPEELAELRLKEVLDDAAREMEEEDELARIEQHYEPAPENSLVIVPEPLETLETIAEEDEEEEEHPLYKFVGYDEQGIQSFITRPSRPVNEAQVLAEISHDLTQLNDILLRQRDYLITRLSTGDFSKDDTVILTMHKYLQESYSESYDYNTAKFVELGYDVEHPKENTVSICELFRDVAGHLECAGELIKAFGERLEVLDTLPASPSTPNDAEEDNADIPPLVPGPATEYTDLDLDSDLDSKYYDSGDDSFGVRSHEEFEDEQGWVDDEVELTPSESDSMPDLVHV